MARETAVTRKTLERNVRRGLWVLTGNYDPSKSIYYVTVTTSKKTLSAGRTMMVSIMETKQEHEARVKLEQEEQLAHIRAIAKRQKENS
jgi:hypothetical protein